MGCNFVISNFMFCFIYEGTIHFLFDHLGAQIEPSPVPTTTEPKVKLVTGEVIEDCPVDFSKKGCFNDLQAGLRPLPQLMFTDLDNSTAQYSGFPVDWGSWDAYLDDVVCRCAQVSKAKGFNLFGIGNFGEYNADN